MPKPLSPPYYLSPEDEATARADASYTPELEAYVRFLKHAHLRAPAALTAICQGLPGNPKTHARMDLYARSRRAIQIQPHEKKLVRLLGENFRQELAKYEELLLFAQHRIF